MYVDQDVEPLRPLDPLLYVPMFAAWEDANSVPNAVWGSVPEHTALLPMPRADDLAGFRAIRGTLVRAS